MTRRSRRSLDPSSCRASSRRAAAAGRSRAPRSSSARSCRPRPCRGAGPRSPPPLPLMVVVAAALSPPGRAVIGDVRDAIGREQVVGAKDAARALLAAGEGPPARRLVARAVDRQPGRLEAAARRLREASVVAVRRLRRRDRSATELDALEPKGTVRWSLARPHLHGARWGGTETDTRIAYLTRRARCTSSPATARATESSSPGSRDVAPAWKPGGEHVLAYVTPNGAVPRRSTPTRATSPPAGRRCSPEQLAFSADGKLIAARGEPGAQRLHARTRCA